MRDSSAVAKPAASSGGLRGAGTVWLAMAIATLGVASPAYADGPETPQAVAAHAEFLAAAPATVPGTGDPSASPPVPATPAVGAVCVIDSGVDLTTDVASRVVSRYAYDGGTLNDTGALSDTGQPLAKHGTIVAGLIASQVDGVGSSGIWPRAQIVSVRVFPDSTHGTTAADYIRAIYTCEQDPARVKVINLSIAGLTATSAELTELRNKIINARTQYAINVVAAAGNSGLTTVSYPALLPESFAVGASDVAGALCSFSNHGAGLDISAPGCPVYYTDPGDNAVYQTSGSSFSAAIVSAVLTALRTYNPALTVTAAEQLLLDNARTTSAGKVLDAAAAFRAVGMAPMVDAYTLPELGGGAGGEAPTSPPPPAPADTAAAASSAPQQETELPVRDAFGQFIPGKPTLRRLSTRRGILDVAISGRRAGQRAIFDIDSRYYVRNVGRLRVHAPHWHMLRVHLSYPGVGPGATLTVHRAKTP